MGISRAPSAERRELKRQRRKRWAVRVVVDFDGKRCQRRDRVDAAGAQQDEAGLVPAAIFQQMNGSPKVMIQKILGTGLSIHSREDAGIGRAIQDPFDRRKIGKILFVADVPHPDIDAEGAEWLQVGLTPFADQAVDASDPDAG